MDERLVFSHFGMSEKEIASFAQIGIKYDKRTRSAYLAEFSSPSIATSSAITELESIASGVLPDDYRNFILSTNGGKPNLDSIFVPNHGWTTIQHFSPLVCRINSITLSHLIKVTYKDRIPKTHLPIATTPGGSWFLLSLNKENHGNIFFWDHEREDDSLGGLLLTADCFSTFLSSLKETAQ